MHFSAGARKGSNIRLIDSKNLHYLKYVLR